MLDNWQIGLQLEFLIDIIFALAAGFVIGAERESRGKPAILVQFFGNRWCNVIYISLCCC